jgi:hypothetical protein
VNLRDLAEALVEALPALVVAGASRAQEVDVHGAALALAVRAVLGLPHEGHLVGQLDKNDRGGGGEVEAWRGQRSGAGVSQKGRRRGAAGGCLQWELRAWRGWRFLRSKGGLELSSDVRGALQAPARFQAPPSHRRRPP